MQINSTKNMLLRARNLRSAKRSRSGKVLSSKLTGSSSTSLASKLSSNSLTASSTQTKQIALYEKMENAANNLQSTVKDMIAIGKMSYTDDETGQKAQETDQKNLLSGVKDFVSDFNTVYGALTDISGTTNLVFKRSLDSIVASNTAALKEIGITVSKTGGLSVDEKTLADADPEKVKALFAKENGFAAQVSDKMESIEASASTTLTVLNKLYGATSTYNKYGTSSSYYNSSYDQYGSSYYNSSSWYI